MGETWRNVDNNDQTFRRLIRYICMADISRTKIVIKEVVAIQYIDIVQLI